VKTFNSRVLRVTLSALETLLTSAGRQFFLYTYSPGGAFRVILFGSVVIFYLR